MTEALERLGERRRELIARLHELPNHDPDAASKEARAIAEEWQRLGKDGLDGATLAIYNATKKTFWERHREHRGAQQEQRKAEAAAKRAAVQVEKAAKAKKRQDNLAAAAKRRATIEANAAKAAERKEQRGAIQRRREAAIAKRTAAQAEKAAKAAERESQRQAAVALRHAVIDRLREIRRGDVLVAIDEVRKMPQLWAAAGNPGPEARKILAAEFRQQWDLYWEAMNKHNQSIRRPSFIERIASTFR